MQRYPSPQLISVKNSSKHLSNVSFPEYEYQRFVIPFSSVPLPIRDISLCFFFTHSFISFSDNRRRELNLPFLGRTHKCLDPIPWKQEWLVRFIKFDFLFHFSSTFFFTSVYEKLGEKHWYVRYTYDTRTTFQHYKLFLIFASKWM